MSSIPNAEVLLAHQDWVRALARSLVDDPARAEDVTQQTLLEAMTRPPNDWRSPRGWLATVARNAARAFARQDSRRRRREAAVAREDVVTVDPATTADRAGAHKRLVDELFALEEPYHTVLLLRFFEDLQAREIAVQLGRPVATVRTQLQRGLERMRSRLDDEFGGRAAWGALLLPLFSARHGVTTATATGTAATFAVWHWLVPLLLLAVGLFVGREFMQGESDPEPLNSASSGVVGGKESGRGSESVATPSPDRLAVGGSSQPVDTGPVPTERPVVGRAILVDGQPAIGLEVAWHDPAMPRLVGRRLVSGNSSMDLDQPSLREEFAHPRGVMWFARRYAPYQDEVAAMIRGERVERPRGVTDGRGEFEIVGAGAVEDLRVERPGWGSYGHGRLPREGLPVLIVGPQVRVEGRVVDSDGVPVAGVYLGASYTLTSLPGAAQQLVDATGFRSFNANTDAAGKFDLGWLPRLTELKITASRRGYQQLHLLPTAVDGELTLTLQRTPEDQRYIVSGFVQHADGRAAAGAALRFGPTGGLADDSGRFEFEMGSPSKLPLTAYVRGKQPAVVEGLGARMKADRMASRDLVLTLGDDVLAISGRVLDARGDPLAGMRVGLWDGTPHGTFHGWLETWMENTDDDGVLTARDGSFTMPGLSARDYTLRAIDPKTLLVIDSAPIAAGSRDVVLQAGADAFIGRVEGVLVDRTGRGIAGARVLLDAVRQRLPHGGTRHAGRETAVESDGAGRFVIPNCPRHHVQLWISGEGIDAKKVAVPQGGEPLRIELQRVLRFRLRVAAPGTAKSLAVVDAAGERLVVTRNSPGSIGYFREHAIPKPNASPVYEVVDTATQLLLLDGDRVVRRIPLALEAGELNELDV